MNLQPITGRAFVFRCCACHARTDADSELGLATADLDGKPFEDYYCGACSLERSPRRTPDHRDGPAREPNPEHDFSTDGRRFR